MGSARDDDAGQEDRRPYDRSERDREKYVNDQDLAYARRLRIEAQGRADRRASRRAGLWYPIVVGVAVGTIVAAGNVLLPAVIAWLMRHVH
jgi:hypothetical protein